MKQLQFATPLGPLVVTANAKGIESVLFRDSSDKLRITAMIYCYWTAKLSLMLILPDPCSSLTYRWQLTALIFSKPSGSN